MPWFKVDDTLSMHAKTLAAGNAAMGLWVRAGAWSMQQLTDGFVPDHVVRTLGTPKERRQLVEVSFWVEVQGGIQFHEWNDVQRTKDQVKAARQAAADRQRDARDRAKSHRESRRDDGVSHAPPDQTRPDQTHSSYGTTPDDADASSSDQPDRPDVDRLCKRLADAIEANGSKRPTIGKAWRDAARLLIDKDGRTEAQVAAAIDWCQNGETERGRFWIPNVMSMPKLRDKYDVLRLQAEQERNAPREESRVQRNLQVVRDLEARAQADAQRQIGGGS